MTATRTLLTLVVACADNGVIGKDGALPWRLPADLKRFKKLTMGKPMIMGRKTFEALPGLLPGRRHIVLTRDGGWAAEGAEPVEDVDSALAACGTGEASVIGGAEIYSLFLPIADRIELTEVHIDPEGDTFLPPLDREAWMAEAIDDHPAEGKNPAYSFVSLVRSQQE